MQDHAPGLTANPNLIFKAALQELAVDHEVWESRKVIDAAGEPESSSVSLQHVFRVLSLTLPKDPLKIAYRGIYSKDDHVHGTALEYLETVLPRPIYERISAILEARAPQPA
jgi:hypothetical protein